MKQLGKQLYVWHFDEGKGGKTEDATAGLVGEFNGDVKWAEGISGSAVEMAGKVGKANFIEVAHSDEIDMDEAITMMAWVYPNELPSGWIRRTNSRFSSRIPTICKLSREMGSLLTTSTTPIIRVIIFLTVR